MQKQTLNLIATMVAGSLIQSTLFANVVGVDSQNFNAITSGLDFVTVQSSETLDPGMFNLGLFANHAVNSLPYFTDENSTAEAKELKKQTKRDEVDAADLNVGLGLGKRWDIGLSLPQILRQKVYSDEFRGEFDNTGNTEVRANTKFRFWGTKTYGIAAVASVSINRLENNPYVGEKSGPISTLELVGDTTVGPVAMGLNVGYRWRNPGTPIAEFPVEPFRNQMIASAAASFLMKPIRSKIIAEAFSSWPVQKVSFDSDRQQSSAEGLLGLKIDATQSLAMHLGAGKSLFHGVSSPDWRVYAGLNWVVGPAWGGKPKVKKKVKPKAAPHTEEEYVEHDNIAAVAPEPTETLVIHDVLFAYDSSTDVLPGAMKMLEELVEHLKRPPAFKKMIVEGHTDYMGTDEYNMELSQRRANAIRATLVKVYGLDPNMIEAHGYGESRPIADNGNYQGRQTNRRVEFKIYRE